MAEKRCPNPSMDSVRLFFQSVLVHTSLTLVSRSNQGQEDPRLKQTQMYPAAFGKAVAEHHTSFIACTSNKCFSFEDPGYIYIYICNPPRQTKDAFYALPFKTWPRPSRGLVKIVGIVSNVFACSFLARLWEQHRRLWSLRMRGNTPT